MKITSMNNILPKHIFKTVQCAYFSSNKNHHKILIIGGGTAGCAMASRLYPKFSYGEVAVVEPHSFHYYQPLWTLVGAGIYPFEQSVKPLDQILNKNCVLYQNAVEEINATNSFVSLLDGTKISYDYLILAVGMTLRYDKITGALEALKTDPRVCSNYSADYVGKTFAAMQAFKPGGQAVFTLPSGAIKCAGAPQKVMYLFEDYLTKNKKRESVSIQYYTATPKLFSVDKYSKSLESICRSRKIDFHLNHNLVEVKSSESMALFENVENKQRISVKYDFLHITPPMSPPELLTNTPKLTNPEMGNYVDVNTKTLRHKTYGNIFSLGDCAALPTSKTAAAVSSQAEVVERNLLDLMKSGDGNVLEYDGYTACPLVTGYDRGIIAEFDYSFQPLETLPLDQSKESYLFYYLKATVIPLIYWDWLVKGLWSGPKAIRRLMHLYTK